METIFDYNVTEKEIEENLFLTNLKRIMSNSYDEFKEKYISETSKEWALFDIALIFEARGKSARKIWKQIPKLRGEYLRGFDDIAIPVDE